MNNILRLAIKDLLLFSFFLCFPVLAISMAEEKGSKGDQTSTQTKIDQPPVTLNAFVDNANPTTSDTITFTILLTFKKDMEQVQIPEIGSLIKGFRIVDFATDGPTEKDDRYEIRKWYKLQTDISGSYVLPSIKISQPGTKGSAEIKTAEIFIEVTPPKSSAKPDGKAEVKDDIRDIKDIIPPKKNYLIHLAIAGSLLLLVAIIFAVIFYLKRKKKVVDIPATPPHELALSSLKELGEGNLLDSRCTKKFHFQLSAIARAYLEGQFGLKATDKTIEEIKREIHTIKDLSDDKIQNFMHILRETDIVKFTDSDPGKGLSLNLLNSTVNFVTETMPKEEVEEQDSVI